MKQDKKPHRPFNENNEDIPVHNVNRNGRKKVMLIVIISLIAIMLAGSLVVLVNSPGKPEPLKNELSGFWSRRITDVHRLVYSIDEDNIYISKCKNHYTGK